MISFLTIQCSSDDSDSPSVSFDDDFLLGEWTVTEVAIEGRITCDGLDSEVLGYVFAQYPIPINAEIEIQNFSINFSKNPNLMTSNGSISASYTAYVNDYTSEYEISDVLENMLFFNNWNWQLDSSIIRVSSENQNENYLFIVVKEDEIKVFTKMRDHVLLRANWYSEETIESTVEMDVELTFRNN